LRDVAQRLRRLLWEQEIASSSPAIPISFNRLSTFRTFGLFKVCKAEVRQHTSRYFKCCSWCNGLALQIVILSERVRPPSSNPFWVNLVNGADILFLGTPLGRVEISPETSRVNVSPFGELVKWYNS